MVELIQNYPSSYMLAQERATSPEAQIARQKEEERVAEVSKISDEYNSKIERLRDKARSVDDRANRLREKISSGESSSSDRERYVSLIERREEYESQIRDLKQEERRAREGYSAEIVSRPESAPVSSATSEPSPIAPGQAVYVEVTESGVSPQVLSAPSSEAQTGLVLTPEARQVFFESRPAVEEKVPTKPMGEVQPTREVFGGVRVQDTVARIQERTQDNPVIMLGVGAVAGVYEAGRAIINPVETTTGIIYAATNPLETVGELGESYAKSPAYFIGETIGQTYGFSKAVSLTGKAAKTVSEINPYTKQQVVFSSAETLGRKGLTPGEARRVFQPKLESINTVETPYGVIEIEIKKPTREVGIEPKVKEVKGEGVNILEEGSEIPVGVSGGVDFSKLAPGRSGVRIDAPNPFLLRETQSLAGGSPSLSLALEEPRVVYIQEVVVESKALSARTNTLGVIGYLEQEQKEVTSISVIPSIKTELRPSVALGVEEVPINKTRDLPEFEVRPKVFPKEKVELTQIPQQKITPIAEIKTGVRQEVKQKQALDLALKPELVISLPTLTRTEERKPSAKLEVRKKGKFEVVDVGDVETLMKKGQDIVKGTLRASYRLKGERGETLDLPTPIGFVKSKKDKGVFVQPRELRLSAKSEVQEIKFAKRKKEFKLL